VSIYHKLAPALYYSPVPERLPSPTQLLYPPSPCSSTDEPILPAISRPSSRSPLPSLSTLASVALPSPPSRLNGGYAMTFATSSPGASTAGQGTTPVSREPIPFSSTLWLSFPFSRNSLTRCHIADLPKLHNINNALVEKGRSWFSSVQCLWPFPKASRPTATNKSQNRRYQEPKSREELGAGDKEKESVRLANWTAKASYTATIRKRYATAWS
jgi:hypothetical protein